MRIKSLILQLPLWILVFASFAGGIYAAATKLQGITWATPIILFIIITLYIVGRAIDKKKSNNDD